jgi:hypothetical protein
MDLYRTTFNIPPSVDKISYKTPVIFMGSCFSEYIGQKLADSKIATDNNPFGIVFNPFSVLRGLRRLINPVEYTKNDLFNHEGIWGSFDHHSRFSGVNNEVVLSAINHRLNISSQNLKTSKFVFLTFGTSYVYEFLKSGEIVANCHKFPASGFRRYRLSVENIVSEYIPFLNELKAFNPDIHIIFTVSPVRHWKDGAHENQLSKSILLLAIDEICKCIPFAGYFPSYELIMDDLRDYRFYNEDMIHPNKVAIDYIWERFKEVFFTGETLLLMKEIEKVTQAAAHRPLNPQSEQYHLFAQQMIEKVRFLEMQYHLNLSKELEFFRGVIENS